jgi:hypothetical protein
MCSGVGFRKGGDKSSARKMKSSLRLSSEKQENTVIQDPPEPWFEVGDEVTFNANNVGVAGTGTVMGVIRLTNDLLRELPDGTTKLTR